MDIYKDIASRTNGEIYIGVVGPVRTGKSTFIKRFMDLCVLPYMEEGHLRERTIDELPQSSQGKTIMTTEPKFIPQNGVTIRIDGNQDVKVRLVDCVGFVVEGANGHMEGDGQRMVRTPWFAEEIPFEDAAKIGTLKVIKEHATIGVVVTCDGSFGEISRENYIKAEEQTIAEMEETRKPYVILLNSERPYSTETQALKTEMEAKYNRPVIAINCKQMQKSDIVKLLESVLLEFPISQVEFYIPKWTEMLPMEHEMKKELICFATEWMEKMTKMRDLYQEDEVPVADSQALRGMLAGHLPTYRIAPHPLNITGKAEGIIVGGNMSVFNDLAGSDFDPLFIDGIVLFIEDTGEGMSKVDRMLHNIEIRGLQKHIRAVIVGQFNKYKHPENGFDDMYALLNEYLQHWHIPVCYNFPVGHAHLKNFPLLTGAKATLEITSDKVVLDYNNSH